jgi:hypothetical protein
MSRFVGVLLEQIAERAEQHQLSDSLPDPERELWEHLGASFGDRDASARNAVAMAAAYADLISERCIIGDAAMAQRLGVDRSRVSQRVNERSVFVVATAADRCYPVWQLAGDRTIPGLRDVLAAIDPSLHPVTVDHWFTTPNVDLTAAAEPMSPALWLATGGRVEAVIDLAADL